jgi:hypothetical protein
MGRLSEVLNDLCASIDAHACPLISMICLRDGEWLSPEAIPPDIETHRIEVCACALETNRMNGSGEC